MDDLSNRDRAVELLQQLGLKEYEAKAFVALTRLPHGTAKEISEISDVPRTRVYDAVRVLETKGLVEIQHSNPQKFRALSVDETAETLRQEYESRTDELREALDDVEPVGEDDDIDVTHEVWGLSGRAAITNRTRQLIREAESDLTLVVGDEDVVTDDLLADLRAVQDRGVTVVVGTVDATLCERIEEALPGAEVFVSGLDWLSEPGSPEDRTEIDRLLLVDGTTMLVSSFRKDHSGERSHQQAVFGRGFDNGLVTIVRRLMATRRAAFGDAVDE